MMKSIHSTGSNPSIKLNMLMNVLLTLSSILIPVITLPYVTRVLGAEGVGRVYFASSVVAGFAMFAELGIPVYGIRACARVRDDRRELSRTVREIMMINLISCVIVYTVFAVMICTVPRFTEDRLLLTIMSSTMILNCIGAEWLYKAVEKYTYITVRSLTFKFIALIAMFVMVRDESDYVIYGAITIFAVSASNIINLCSIHRYADLRPTGRHDLARHLPGMLMLFALAAATTIYTNLDLAILDFMKGDAEAGLYGVAVKIKLVIVSMVTSVSAVLLPRNSFYYEKNRKDEFYGLISRTMGAVLTVSLPVLIYFIIFARESISVLAGDGFSGAVAPMMIIMPSVAFIGVSNIIGIQMLVPAGREKTVVTAAMIGAAVDLILNLILIPGYASSGAAAATLAAEICVTGYMLYAVRDRLSELFSHIPVKGILTALAGVLAAGLLIKQSSSGAFTALCISSICCFGIYSLIMYLYGRRDRSR